MLVLFILLYKQEEVWVSKKRQGYLPPCGSHKVDPTRYRPGNLGMGTENRSGVCKHGKGGPLRSAGKHTGTGGRVINERGCLLPDLARPR